MNSAEEDPDEYFILPKRVRSRLLQRFQAAGVHTVFAGHLHRNVEACTGDGKAGDRLRVVVTTSSGAQIGPDTPGINVVRVPKEGSSNTDVKLDYCVVGKRIT